MWRVRRPAKPLRSALPARSPDCLPLLIFAKGILMASREQKSGVDAQDILSLLCADHQHVIELFAEFRHIKDHCTLAEKEVLVQEICSELLLHTELEEEVFYPAIRDVLQDDMLMDEAEFEHANAKDVIEELEALNPSHPSYNAKVVVLGENIERHMREEQTVVFPKVKKSRLDLQALGEEMMHLRSAKQTQLMNGMNTSRPQRVAYSRI
jgi:iron-sulfur cluster repair protein YtfE (RIC family)